MSNTLPVPAVEEAALPPLARRMAISFALFSAVFLGLLLASRVFLVPRFSQLPIGGSLIPSAEVPAVAAAMEEELRRLEKERDAFVLPGRDARYAALRAEKFALPALVTIRSAVRETAIATGGAPGVVALSTIELDADAATVTVTGDVRTADPGSMTVLARFVEALEELPFVASLTPPPFSREETEDGFRSPFTVTFTVSPQ